jgi:hypothetical protein
MASGTGQVCILGISGSDRKTGVVLGKIVRQEGVGGFHVANARQPQGFDQPILQGLEQPLQPPLRLGVKAWMVSIPNAAVAR